MQQLLQLLEPGNIALYLMALLVGLYVQYRAAVANNRTSAASFADYWLKETPGMSIATVVVLVTVAGATIQSGMLTSMSSWGVFSLGFLKGFGFDALIQAPSSAAAAAPKQGGFARLGMLLTLLSLLLFVGCASLGLQTADTFNQKLAYSYGQVTAARKGALAVINAKCPDEAAMQTDACKSAVKDGQHVQAMADEARQGLDAAKGYAMAGNLTAASTQLQLESAALTALQTYLSAKGVQ
jgi:hypothetical protein